MRTYNPLSVDELGRNATRALMSYPAIELPLAESFNGSGVYTLHYVGAFPAYVGMDKDEPIYVGKADLPGKRQGQSSAHQALPALYRRLQKHVDSIENVRNLHLHDFKCRWLILDSVWIGLTEQVLIAKYRPIWNVVVDGFGNNDPGKGRWNQRCSQWDTLHPGRPWAENLRKSSGSSADILKQIQEHSAKRSDRSSGTHTP